MILQEEFSERWLAAGSSPVDWCEDNYRVNSHIAEFTNTVSNLAFFVVVPICMLSKFWKIFYRHVSIGAHIQLFMLLVIGASSAYFHATLSLLGQLLDELAIIWAICLGYATFTPNSMRPSFYHGKMAYAISVVAGILCTGLWFVAPYLNAFVMMLVVYPILALQFKDVRQRKNKRLRVMSFAFVFVSCLAVSLWVADRTMCGVWRKLNIPGLHSLWHISSSVSFYFAISIYSYIKTADECPFLKPSIKFLPDMSWGIPYVHVKESYS